jgi:hypothetical protein
LADKVIHTFELGLIHEAQGHYQKAGEHFSAVLKEDPANPTLMAALERVTSKPTEPVDLSTLSKLVEQWISLVLLRQRLAILGRNLNA